MNNIEDKTQKKCTGCGACISICPVSAIGYKINEYGFYKAFVNEDKCIRCGKCKKVCVKYNENNKVKLKDGILYSAMSKDENVVKKCTSGGIAYEIARYGINNGYYILGVIYNYEKEIAESILTNKIEDLEKIKGSKYLQSDMGKATTLFLNKCKEDINNKFIIFGTPCQLEGISRLVETQKIKNEIIKIDLFCHGVPSYRVWEQYLNQIKLKNDIDKIKECNFRSKEFGWHQYCIEINTNDNKLKIISGKSDFYKTFFDNMFLNDSCYDCNVRQNNSYADIRLGDFWGKKYYSDLKGVSAVLVLTSKGKQIIEKINDNINLFQENNVEECLENQSVKKYSNYDFNNKFKKMLLSNDSISKTIKCYRKELSMKKKIKCYLRDNIDKISPILKYKIKLKYYKFKEGIKNGK